MIAMKLKFLASMGYHIFLTMVLLAHMPLWSVRSSADNNNNNNNNNNDDDNCKEI